MTQIAEGALVASGQFMRAAERLPVLWELAEEFTHLVDLLEDPDADPADVEAEMQRVAGDIQRKAGGVATVIGALEGLAGFQKANAERLQAKARANQAHADRLRSYALACMKTIGVDRLETGSHTLSVRLNNPSVTVVDAAAIPHEFNRTKVIVEPDKVGILAHFKATGELVPGVDVTRSERLDIR
jgi:Siphovirus Gp157